MLFIIKCYWQVVPPHKRRYCLFRESCSRYVFRVVLEQGSIQGFKAFARRYRTCRPGYQIDRLPNGQPFVIFPNGEIIDEQLISEHLIDNLKS